MKARITIISNSRCSVEFKFPGLDKKARKKERTRIVNLLDDALAIEQKGAHFMPTVQNGRWDGRRHLFYADGCTFPKGIMPRVKSLLREAEYKVLRTRDERKRPHPDVEMEISEDMLAGVTLHEHQMRVLTAALENGCGLLHVATGGGKTELGAAIIKALPQERALFLVHTKQLLHQARERIALRLGTIEEYIGIIGDGKFEPKHITVATVQSLNGVRGATQKKVVAKYLKSIGLLILDETHHASAKTFYRLVQRIDAPWRYGMSGTPFGLADGKGLMVEAAFGPVVERVTNEELGAKGINARPVIRMVEVDTPDLADDLDWDSVYKEGIVLNEARNELVASWSEKFASKKWPTLVMVRQLWHGDNISSMLRERNVPHAFVHGQMPTSEVERQKERLVEGKIRVLIASPIFGEGVDVPSIRALVIADGGQSTANVLQKIGRGLRRKDGDNRVDVVDFADTSHRWLAVHSQNRIQLYESEGFEVIADASLRSKTVRKVHKKVRP